MNKQKKVTEPPLIYTIFNFILVLIDKLKGIIILAMLLVFTYYVIKLILPYDVEKISKITAFFTSFFDNKVYVAVLLLLAVVLIIINIICYSGKKNLQKEIGVLRDSIDKDDDYNPSSNMNEYGTKQKK